MLMTNKAVEGHPRTLAVDIADKYRFDYFTRSAPGYDSISDKRLDLCRSAGIDTEYNVKTGTQSPSSNFAIYESIAMKSSR